MAHASRSVIARVPEPVSAELAELRDRVAALERAVQALQSGRGAHADADVRLLVAIETAAAGLPFRAKDVIRRAGDVPALAAAVDDAFIETSQELGKLFARLRGAPVAGVRLERVKFQRGGWLWRIVRTDPQCSADVRHD